MAMTGTTTSHDADRPAPFRRGRRLRPAAATGLAPALVLAVVQAAGGGPAGAATGATHAAAKGRVTTTGAYAVSHVDFTAVTPAHLTPTESWNAQGLDDAGRVYSVWTSTRTDGREDSALFRYTPATGGKEYLGSFIDRATAQGNIQPGEEIPKGHTAVVQVGRKMFMASQGFHDFKEGIDALPTYRGAHLFSYDLDTGAFDDVSRTAPGGVAIAHQGIVALAYSPETKLLVGLSHPLGDLVLIDPATGKVRKVVPGIPWALNKMVSREIVVTRDAKVYTYRGPEDPELRADRNQVWVYDLRAGTMKRTGQSLLGGFWNGQAQTADRSKVYVSTVSGELYRLDVATGRFTDLGQFVDAKEYASPAAYRVAYLYGISLSAAEDAVVGAPFVIETGNDTWAVHTQLTRYDVARRTFAKDAELTLMSVTGSSHRDRDGVIYQASFGEGTTPGLLVLTPKR